MMTKNLPEHAVYSDVVNTGLILPKKQKYTIRDFRKLLTEGWNQVDARWIILCSAAYWNAEPNKKLESANFLKLCQYGIAHL